MPDFSSDYPPKYLERVKAFREEHQCSLQAAVRAVKKAWAMELLAASAVDDATRTLFRLLIQENFNGTT